jgi:hypothetical protein
MMQTLKEVADLKDTLLKALKKRHSKNGGFSKVSMDGVTVFPDKIVRSFYTMTYLMDTHFVPGMLPGCGMSIGDILSHEGKDYFTTDLRVCQSNIWLLHIARAKEDLIRGWESGYEGFHYRVSSIIGAAFILDPQEGLGLSKYKVKGLWNDTSTGFTYVGAPSEEFIRALRATASKTVNPQTAGLVSLAVQLSDELEPYSAIPALVGEMQNKTHHKGTPCVNDGILALTSPSASGGSTWHTVTSNDDVHAAIPSSVTIWMMACQAGNHTNMRHVGGGSVEGIHYTLVLPRTPFFAETQERIDADPALVRLWQQLGPKEDNQSAHEWDQATAPHKIAVLKQMDPMLFAGTVLGFEIDLISEKGTAFLRPVISASVANENMDLITEMGWNRHDKEYEEHLGYTGESYYHYDDILS